MPAPDSARLTDAQLLDVEVGENPELWDVMRAGADAAADFAWDACKDDIVAWLREQGMRTPLRRRSRRLRPRRLTEYRRCLTMRTASRFGRIVAP